MTDDELIDAMDGFPCGTESGHHDRDDCDFAWTFQWTADDGWEVFEPADD